MWKPDIPKKEVEGVLETFWTLLRSLEMKTSKDKDRIDAHLVTQAYDQLNRLGVSDVRPEWEGK